MGKKAEKSSSKERHAITKGESEETDKTAEPYKCVGNFMLDFNELCKQNQVAYTPAVITRPRLPAVHATTSDTKLEKKGDKKQAPIVHEVDLELESIDGTVEGPPKTYITKDKFQYFKPNVQVELDNNDKWDTVTEVYVRGWKIDGPMMEVFQQCWRHLTKLHTINLWNTGLTEETLNTLASFLPKCSTVKNLILDGNSVKEENWPKLLGDHSIIQNLSLRYCNISDKGAAGFGKALGTAKSGNTKLVSLNLAGNQIGDAGAESLAEGLRTNRTLLSLILTNNDIGDRGAVKLSETISRFPLTHEEVVVRRTLMSEKGPIERKSPLPSRRSEPKDRPASVRGSVTTQDKAKQKLPAKKKDVKLKDSKEDIKSQKKDKEDTKSVTKKDSRASRGASSATDVTKIQGKAKEKKKGTGKSSTTDADSSDSQDQISPLLEPAESITGQLWIPGNRALINLNLSRNKIGEVGLTALLNGIQHQMTLTLENKSSGIGLLRLVINKNAVPPNNEIAVKLNEIMLRRDPFYKPPSTSESPLL